MESPGSQLESRGEYFGRLLGSVRRKNPDLRPAPPKLLGSEISSAPSRAALGSKLFEESGDDSRPELPPSVILPLAVPQ